MNGDYSVADRKRGLNCSQITWEKNCNLPKSSKLGGWWVEGGENNSISFSSIDPLPHREACWENWLAVMRTFISLLLFFVISTFQNDNLLVVVRKFYFWPPSELLARYMITRLLLSTQLISQSMVIFEHIVPCSKIAFPLNHAQVFMHFRCDQIFDPWEWFTTNICGRISCLLINCEKWKWWQIWS